MEANEWERSDDVRRMLEHMPWRRSECCGCLWSRTFSHQFAPCEGCIACEKCWAVGNLPVGEALVSRRKLRLLACGLTQLLENYESYADWRKVLITAQCYADGIPTPFGDPNTQSLEAARRSIDSVYGWLNCATRGDILGYLDENLRREQGFQGAWRSPRAAQVVRDLFGNPFVRAQAARPYVTDCVVQSTAWAIYRDRDWSALPILADAIMDVCGQEDDVTDHLRSQKQHWLGCWALDVCCQR